MATKPEVQTLNANSVDVLNAVRNDASAAYRAAVPVAEPTIESIREIGQTIMNFQAFQNEFLSTLINRIGMVILQSKLYDNPWAVFKRGILEYGETVEEIFTNIAKPHIYNVELSETNQFKREMPDVKTAFHYLNYQTFYKTTVQSKQLKQAFLSWEGVTQLISSIIDSLYSGANYDEFVMMKYLIAKKALEGHIYPMTIPTVNAENAKSIVSTVKGVSNQMEFMSGQYNEAGVLTYSDKRRQYVILNASFDAVIDVEVLASAFNMDKAEFMGRRILVDSFANQDQSRLGILLKDDPTYQPFTQAELTKLQSIPAVIVDEDWFMIYDNLFEFTEKFNGEGLYWNYWFHTWKIFSSSPFANAVMFTTDGGVLTGLTISPATATAFKGGSVSFVAIATGDGFAPATATWSVDGTDSYMLGNVLHIGVNETSASLTVTATSTLAPTVTATATVTVI